MNNEIQALTEDLQQAKVALKQIYKALHSVKCANGQEENVQETPTINTSTENINAVLNRVLHKAEKEPVSEKEFNYQMAAHDLLSPLAIQFTLLDALKGKLESALEHIDFLSVSNSKSLKISRAALSSAQQVKKPIVFKKLINGIVQLLGIEELHKDIDIVVRLHHRKDFFSNVAMVQSIVQNLIQNAIKYRKRNQNNTITITVEDINNGVKITIQDTGVGMDEQRVQQLFSTAVSNDTTVQDSHGFGLYGVAQYVQKLNGKITAESVVNVGSTFTVTLPTLAR